MDLGTISLAMSDKQIEAILQNKDTLFRQLGETIDAIFWLREAQSGKLLYISPAFEKYTGRTPEEVRASPSIWLEHVHPDDKARITALKNQRSQDICNLEYRYIGADNEIHWVHDRSVPIRDDHGNVTCIAGILQDITAAKSHEEQIRFLNQLYAALSHTHHAIMECDNEFMLFEQVCRIAVEFGGMTMAWIGVHDPATCRIKPVAQHGSHTEYLDGLEISSLESKASGRGPSGIAFRERRAEFVQDFMTSSITAPWRERGRPYGWRASGAMCLLRGGQPFGVLTIYHSKANAFDRKTTDLLQEMASTVSMGLDRIDSRTERTRHEAELKTNNARYHAILETSLDGFILIDWDSHIVDVNSAYVRKSGYSRDQLLQMRIADLQALDKPEQITNRINLLAHEGSIQFETIHRTAEGKLWPLEVKAVMLPGDKPAIFAFLRDLSERKRAEEEIINLGFYDPLTALPNRRLLMDRLRHAMAASVRSQAFGAVLFIDLDHFKDINDTEGHETGDLLLKEVAARLGILVREQDTIARLGGDEFIAVVEDLHRDKSQALDDARQVGEKLLHAFAQPYVLNGEEFVCTASIGIVMFRDHDVSIDDILRHSDMAMYGAKKSGRNTLRFFDPNMQHELEERTRLEADLRRGIQDQQLRLFCQPQVNSQGTITGAEVLLRWEHPERGMIPPMEFIPFAEQSGLITSIGQWVLEHSCLLLKSWEHFLPDQRFVLSVNVSAREFRQQNFVENLRRILKDTAVNPTRLGLEITETMLVEGIEEMIVKMVEMRGMGLKFSMDDFGTGYSSLSYLKKLPLNELKIDRSFVQDLGTDISDEAIVQTIIRMSETLGLSVVAEGVETEAQRAMLLEYGCQHFQGYLFGKPVPADRFTQLLKEQYHSLTH